MIERYSQKQMKNIWSEEQKYNIWLQIEILALEAYQKHNKFITQEVINKIKKNAKINVKRIMEIENVVKHDVIAFTRSLSEMLGDEKKWIHYGLTSTDVVDTTQGVRFKMANKIILKDLKELISILKSKAKKYQNTYQIGRTHGIHAEITTLGYKFALWYDEMNRNLMRFTNASLEVEVAKISGVVGNYANIPIDVQEYVAKKLHLRSSKISTQVLQRDRHANYINTLAIIATSLDKFSTNLRQLQSTEINEVSEMFDKNQKGSSAMPHKKNPIGLENISGLSRVMRGYSVTAMENIVLWSERDISHSSAERIIFEDSTILIDYMLSRFTKILKNLNINKNKMLKNIKLTNGVIFSQKVMLYLINEKKKNRDEVYDLIQPLAIESYDNGKCFKDLLIKNNILNLKEANKIFDFKNYTKNIQKIFDRLKI